MKKVASKSILMMLVLLLTLSSFSTTIFAVEKKDEKGEILNLPPFVDFEVKEKRKVDIIVDVGNTSYTMEQINSMVNEQLRPKLQASGLDYKVHVEKSSEGITKYYYFSTDRDYVYSSPTTLYSFDILTKQFKKEYLTTFSHAWDVAYDPETTLLFSRENVFLADQTKVPPERFSPNGYPTVTSRMASTAKIAPNGMAISRRSYHDPWNDPRYLYSQRSTTDILEAIKNGESTKLKDQHVAAGLDYPTFRWDLIYSDGTWMYDNIIAKGAHEYYFDPTVTTIPTRNYVRGAAQILSYSKETGEIIISRITSTNSPHNPAYNLAIYNPTTGETRTFTENPGNLGSQRGRVTAQFLDGVQLVYSDYSTGFKMKYLEDYRDPSSEVSLDFLNNIDPRIYTNVVAHFGDYIVVSSGSYRSYFVNIATQEVIEAYTDGQISNTPFKFPKLPDWYTAKKRYITDILQEVPYRTDAEKYYVRLDHSAIPHLDRQATLGNTIAELSKQQIDYVSIGSSSNEVVTNKIQTALGKTQRYNISEINTAFGNIGSYITDKKEVDLHILMAQPGVTDASITTAIKDLTTQLQKSNIIVKPQYVKGTNSSTLYELLNQVNWRDDRNNYVLWLNQGAMSEFNDPLVEEEVSLLLKGNYTFFTAMGSATNKVANESLIASNNGNGYFFAGTNMSYMTGELKKYVEATAVKNPKRVSDTLVLNYDSTTGDYSSDVMINTYYEDFEKDRKINERFLTTHDPSVYENNTGVMEGIGQYQESPTTKFTKVGLYEMVVQVQDDPTANTKFTNYNLWSQDSLSRLVLYVHRAPVAEFSTIVNSSRILTIQDYSYDLDRYSQRNKGVTTWVWKWKKVDDADWTVGKPPSQLQANTDYFVALKVKDIDGAWSSEVVKYVTTNPFNQPPVALFTIDPKSVSWNKQAVITDRSYDPDGDTITSRDWKVYRENKLILSSGTTPTMNQIKAAAVAAGFNQLGSYKISLRVKDFDLWSETYTDFLEIINYPPIADFEPLEDTYRDTVNKVTNLTANPDQDGDNVTYQWKLYYGDKTYNLGTAQHPSFKIKDRGLGKLAVGTWQLELKASDPLGASSYMTHAFDVVNQVPTTTIISGRSTGYINEPYAYTSSRSDADTEDVASLQSFWRLTSPSGKVREWYTQNISITYVEKGSYVLENWVVDQLDAKSEVDKKNITILNLAPIPGFTMNPNPTYRGTDVNFVSKATDMDGYVDKFMYYIVKLDGTTVAISGTDDFKRPFSTLGIFTIKQVVVDNDGASAEISKDLVIQNRIPVANITEPIGTTAATATRMDATPRIAWTYEDLDNDPQVRYNVVVRSSKGQQVYATGSVPSSSKAMLIPDSANLAENVVYNVSVQVYDGYDWSSWSSLKYFYIVRNSPPVAGFTWSPSVIWEGDSIKINHQVNDPDNDDLKVNYKVTNPKGTVTNYPSSSTSYTVAPANYNAEAFTINAALVGQYTITQTVTDEKSDPVSITKRFTVGELTVLGDVQHTDEWEQNRIKYNAKNPGAQRDQLTFWAGERFVLSADTTNTGSSLTKATKVDVVVRKIGSTTLSTTNTIDWEGYIGSDNADVKLQILKDGEYEFKFKATYSNGVTKEDIVIVTIKGNWTEYHKLHQSW